MKHICCLLTLILVASRACCQAVYANTDNLLLRDRTGTEYNVLAVLRKGCPLKTEPYDFAEKNKAIKGTFYHVSLDYDAEGRHFHIVGWVVKKYTGKNTRATSVPLADCFEPVLTDNNPHEVNSALYLPPRYKGGEPRPARFVRKYHRGKRGGCYYLNSHGHKVYVDRKFCKDK